MRGSLQEQLLKSGLVKDKAKNKKPKKKSKSKRKTPPQSATNNNTAPIARKPLADNELEKPVKAQIKQILKENRVNSKEAEIPYNYTIGTQVKRCYVTENQLQQLSAAELVIVNWNDRSYLIPSSLVSELLELHPDLRLFNTQEDAKDENPKDPYDEFPIPDDLTW